MSTTREITNLIFIQKRILKSDIAIVLSNNWIKTMDDLLPFYKNGFFKKIIITGHSHEPSREPEAIRFNKRALDLGYKSEDIILEIRATNTKENFKFSKMIVEKIMGLNNVKAFIQDEHL